MQDDFISHTKELAGVLSLNLFNFHMVPQDFLDERSGWLGQSMSMAHIIGKSSQTTSSYRRSLTQRLSRTYLRTNQNPFLIK
jgi:hypothetical protein